MARCRRVGLDVPVAVAGAAVVVGIVISAVVLRDPAVVVMVVMVSCECDARTADRDCERCDSGHDPPSGPGQHRVIPSRVG
jgi:hypothetical protein